MVSFHGEPVVAASGDGRLELFAFGPDGGLWHAWQAQWSNNSDWYGWCDGPAGKREGDGRSQSRRDPRAGREERILAVELCVPDSLEQRLVGVDRTAPSAWRR